MIKYYVDTEGKYIGAFEGVQPPQGSSEIMFAPEDANMVWTGNEWIWPSELKRQKALEAIAKARYEHEIAGITANGVRVYTDRTTQNKLTAAYVRAARDPVYTLNWKQLDGTFVSLTSGQIIAIADLVGDYVQACYTRESELVAAVENGSYVDGMLLFGWPIRS